MTAQRETDPAAYPGIALLTDIVHIARGSLHTAFDDEETRINAAIKEEKLWQPIFGLGERAPFNLLLNEYEELLNLPPISQENLPDSMAREEIILSHMSQLGTMILLRRNLGRQRNYLPKARIDLEEFVACGELAIPFGDATIYDFLRGPANDQELESYYRALVFGLLINNKDSEADVEAVAQKVQGEPMVSFPNHIRYKIRSAAWEITALANVSASDLKPSDKTPKTVQEKAARTTYEFFNKVFSLRQRLYRGLLDPSSSEFAIVKRVVEDFSRAGEYEGAIALYPLGLNEENHIYTLYRLATAYTQEDREVSFYTSVVSILRNWVKTFRPNLDITVGETFIDTLEEAALANQESTPTFAQLKAITTSIFSATSQREFQLDLETSNQIPIPTRSVRVTFRKDKPFIFEVAFSYSDKKGDMRSIKLIFDTKRGLFDWNILEAPSQLPSLQALCMRIAEKSLLATQKQVSASRSAAAAVGIDTAARVVTKPSANRGGGGSGLPAGKSRKRYHGHSPLEDMSDRKPASTSDRKGAHPPARNNHISRIVVPEKPRWEKMTDDLSRREQKMVKGALVRLKQNSLHALRNLASQRVNGRIRYEEAVTTQLFIVLEEVASANGGGPHFQIVAIRRT